MSEPSLDNITDPFMRDICRRLGDMIRLRDPRIFDGMIPDAIAADPQRIADKAMEAQGLLMRLKAGLQPDLLDEDGMIASDDLIAAAFVARCVVGSMN